MPATAMAMPMIDDALYLPVRLMIWPAMPLEMMMPALMGASTKPELVAENLTTLWAYSGIKAIAPNMPNSAAVKTNRPMICHDPHAYWLPPQTNASSSEIKASPRVTAPK